MKKVCGKENKMTVDPVQIGSKVKSLRKLNNLTQEQLAESINVSWRTISNLETGRVIPKLDLIYGLAKHFDITIDELLDTRITKNKSVTRIRKENQVIQTICLLDDRLLTHMEEYLQLIKKDFE